MARTKKPTLSEKLDAMTRDRDFWKDQSAQHEEGHAKQLKLVKELQDRNDVQCERLKQLLGETKLYEERINTFLDGHNKQIAEINELKKEKKDWEESLRQAHAAIAKLEQTNVAHANSAEEWRIRVGRLEHAFDREVVYAQNAERHAKELVAQNKDLLDSVRRPFRAILAYILGRRKPQLVYMHKPAMVRE